MKLDVSWLLMKCGLMLSRALLLPYSPAVALTAAGAVRSAAISASPIVVATIVVVTPAPATVLALGLGLRLHRRQIGVF